MTRLFDKALKRLHELPPDRREEAARLILDRYPADETAPHADGNKPFRPEGWMKATGLPDSFFEPLDDELLDLFEGKSLGEQLKTLGYEGAKD